MLASLINSSTQFSLTVVWYLPRNVTLTSYARFAYHVFEKYSSGGILHRIYKNYVLSAHSFSLHFKRPAHEQIGYYRIVPSKRPWALAAHARIIMGGRLHGGAL